MAVVKYVLAHKHFLYGYRYLAWQMIDDNVAFVRSASVYNIMKEYDLVHKWAKNEEKANRKKEEKQKKEIKTAKIKIKK